MSSQALLDAVETAGREAFAQLEQETGQQVEAVLAGTRQTAESRREAARQEVLRPLAAERARRLHEAQMEALKITAAARDEIVEKQLAQVEARLQTLRDAPHYPAVFRQLVVEAVQQLGDGETAASSCLAIDARDEPLAQDVLRTLASQMTLVPELTTWGGVVARSEDGRIIVTNTLEARLEQLKPRLGTLCPILPTPTPDCEP